MFDEIILFVFYYEEETNFRQLCSNRIFLIFNQGFIPE